MSSRKAVPGGLKNQECKKGNWKKRPPIPYVPIVDEVQEAVAKGKEFSYKIKFPYKTEFSVPIWDTGTQEAFFIHVQQAKSAWKRKGCSRTTTMPLRWNRKPQKKPRTSEKPLQI